MILGDFLKKYEKNIYKKNALDSEVINFHLPIYYLENKETIPLNTVSDLELNKTDEHKSLYENIFECNNKYDNQIVDEFSRYYTVDTKFLKDYQKFIKKYNSNDNYPDNNYPDNTDTDDLLKRIRNETNFNEKYNYIENTYLQFLNKIPIFLQALTIYNISSPVLTLMMPIFILLLPFVLLRGLGPGIRFKDYLDTLLKILRKNSIFEGLISFRDVTFDRKIIIIVSTFLYVSNIYQNIFRGYTCYKNLSKIQKELIMINNFYKKSSQLHSNIKNCAPKSWKLFIEKGDKIKSAIDTFSVDLDQIGLETINIKKLASIGLMLKCYHELYKDENHAKYIEYMLFLASFDKHIGSIKNKLNKKQISFCKFSKNKIVFKDIYYPALINSDPVKNDVILNKNYIITGPNASGKTTILKSVILNYIMSQQIGIGCYNSATIKPFRYIHSYINIPDTSERDSLFQAEARRCKNIIDSIDIDGSKDNHLCILDELYSGTNPNEAVASGYALLQYLASKKNVTFFLTTHYYEMCNLLNDNENIENYHMVIEDDKFLYKLSGGQSKAYGGLKVLKDLEYPEEIIEKAKITLDNYLLR